MKFTLKQMRYAEAAGRLGSIAKAAAELNISQSSIAAAIDGMEASLGVDLFLRQPAKGIVPTPAGRRAMALMREMLASAAALESEFECLDGAARGTLRLGCYATVAPHVLPRILKTFSERCPEARIELHEGDLAEMQARLASGEVDLAITYVRPERDAAPADAFEPLFDAIPYALVPAESRLAERRSVTLAELAARPFVLLDLPRTREYFTGLFRAEGLELEIAHSTRSSEILRALVGAGFGVSILNIRSGREHLPDSPVRCLPLEGAPPAPRLGIAMTPGLRRPAMARAFLEVVTGLREAGAFRPFVMPTAEAMRADRAGRADPAPFHGIL
jgi:DNA-binding transcriptional LysR family regulator